MPKCQAARRLPQVIRQFTHQATDLGLWIRSSDLYRPGVQLRISVPGSHRMADVKIVEAFTPFTSSVALVIDPRGISQHLPSRVVLKLADRRFAGRFDPWNPEQEAELQTKLPMYLDEFGECTNLCSEKIFTDDLLWIRELKYWHRANKDHHIEREAYERLAEAQSLRLIPRFFGTTRITMSSDPVHPSLDYIDGLLLEYIPGHSMDSIKPGVDISEQEAEDISQKVLELGRRLRRYGVTHNDMHLGNVVLRPPNDNPVLIDWGLAKFNMVDAPLEERWNNDGMRWDYNKDLRYRLEVNLWHRFRTPLADEERTSWRGWAAVNRTIAGLPEHELERFYYEDRSVAENDGLRWKVKKGVRTRLSDDPVPDA